MESTMTSCGRRQLQELISLAAQERCSSDCRTLKEESKCYHDLATGLHQLLSFLSGDSDDANNVNIFSSLKGAKDLASNIIEW